MLHASELKKAVHVDKGSLRRDRVSAAGTDMLEIEANAFAAELLMPRSFSLQHLMKGWILKTLRCWKRSRTNSASA